MQILLFTLVTNFESFQPFFAIPKSPKNKKANKSRFWRLDFHDQERNILMGAKKEYVKPLIKLLKVKPKQGTDLWQTIREMEGIILW